MRMWVGLVGRRYRRRLFRQRLDVKSRGDEANFFFDAELEVSDVGGIDGSALLALGVLPRGISLGALGEPAHSEPALFFFSV
jgi:hypothetical protein